MLVLGGTLRKPGQCYVIPERNAYPCSSLTSAVDYCYKMFQVLQLDYSAQSQPFVLVLGGTPRKHGQCYVIPERNAYPCSSLTSAVDYRYCYKLFQVLHLDYSAQAATIYDFLDRMIYGIRTKESSVQAIQQFVCIL